MAAAEAAEPNAHSTSADTSAWIAAAPSEPKATGHTKGKWKALPLGDKGLLNVAAPDGPVAFTGTAKRSKEENEANARLIAAAPDLLAACEVALYFIECGDGEREVRSTLRNAIAKAKVKL